jgi:hypothetical protein
METQLTTAEIEATQQLLQNNEAAQKALFTLQQNHGNLEASFDVLWVEKFGRQDFGKGKSLLQLTISEIRLEICGDAGLRGKLKEYTANPGSASLLNGVIGSLVVVGAAHGLPLDHTIATIVVLYILKVGLNVFCKYTESDGDDKKSV